MSHVVDPAARTWVPAAQETGFPVQHLPYGVFRGAGDPRVGVRIGEWVLDLTVVADRGLFGDDLPDAAEVFAADSLNPFFELGPAAWTATRARLAALLDEDDTTLQGDPTAVLVPVGDVEMLLPFAVADYVDFYSSIEHATNLGRLFRPDSDPLLPNWRHLPVAYHGRAGTVVPSGTPIVRPQGQRKPPDAQAPTFGPSQRLDIELEVGVVIGAGSALGDPVPANRVGEHVFGIVLVNDWSARDIQAWEYQPLGPFLGKSFATSIGTWVTPLDALAPFRVQGPPQEPPVLEYLRHEDPWHLDLQLWVELNGETISQVDFRRLYWSVAQQVAHCTANGASLRPGDLLASGTVSGDAPGTYGSLIELTENGRKPLEVGREERTFLADDDVVVLRGAAGGAPAHPRIELAPVQGRIIPARPA